jgi:7-carboxy-7-deazaguanine synthase
MLGINKQEPMLAHHDSQGRLAIHSIWKTVQGEGPFAGSPAVFVRLFGCNLQCNWCDTDYTSRRVIKTPTGLLANIGEITPPNKLVVFTGGEPFRQNLIPALNALFDIGYLVQIETNGTLYSDVLPALVRTIGNRGWLTIVCSPKTRTINKLLIPYIDAWKYILSADSVCEEDGLPLMSLGLQCTDRVARPPEHFPKNKIYVQPLDDDPTAFPMRHAQAAVQSCMKFGYRLSIQTHKLLGLQ